MGLKQRTPFLFIMVQLTFTAVVLSFLIAFNNTPRSMAEGNTNLNNNRPCFYEDLASSISAVSHSSVDWGDYDNDGDLDLVFVGRDINDNAVSKIYRNQGNGNLVEITGATLTTVFGGSVAWGDYDSDNDLDLVLMGGATTGISTITKLYENNGNSDFTERTDISIIGLTAGDVAWIDYDGDGDLDLTIAGEDDSINMHTKIYKNDGNGNFAEDTGLSIEQAGYGNIEWGDYDNDGDPDLLLTGLKGDFDTTISKIYRNNGSGDLIEDGSLTLPGVFHSSAAWGDYDQDGDLDLILTGIHDQFDNTIISKLYNNDGAGNLNENTTASIIDVAYGGVAWGDYDVDGDLDLLLTGSDSTNISTSKLYENIGAGKFEQSSLVQLPNLSSSSVTWADYDSDGDLDFLITGSAEDTISKIYHNGLGDCTWAYLPVLKIPELARQQK